MGSPAFGMPSSGNNAPPPTFGSFTNPTGSQTPGFNGGGSFPSFPVFGSPSSGTPVSPLANAPAFGLGGMSGMSSGFDLGNNWSSFANDLGKAYGKGPGQSIYNILSQGLFNPQTANAFLNAMQPGINRGVANLQSSFGAEGARFGSSAALGQGDFLSQANLNEQQTMASMYMQAQQEQLQLLEGVLPTLHGEQANKGSWLDDVVGGLEIGGAVLGAPFTGGASLALLGPGASMINKGISGGGGSASPMPAFGNPNGPGYYGGGTSGIGMNENWGGGNINAPALPGWGGSGPNALQASGGQDLGGANFDFSDPSNPLFGMLQ